MAFLRPAGVAVFARWSSPDPLTPSLMELMSVRFFMAVMLVEPVEHRRCWSWSSPLMFVFGNVPPPGFCFE
jgi:hypothetical protein